MQRHHAPRSRRPLARLGSLLSFALLLAGCGRESAPARHVLLISVDTLQARRLHCYGGREGVSPVIDRLAAEGTLFEQCYAPMGMTLSCCTSLMTSKYPDETGVLTNQHAVGDQEYTLAERLADAGFRCRALVANGVLAPQRSGIDQGFADGYRVERDEVALTDEACEILEHEFGRDDTRRDFLWLHYMNPHQPYDPPEPYASMFDPDYKGNLDTSPRVLDGVFVHKVDLPQRDLDHVLAVYDGQVRLVDDLLARVMAALKKSGVEDETLVVFTADHGEELYEHNCYFYHANSLYGSVTHVPLILRQSGAVPAARRVPSVVELVDVAPTIQRFLGVEWAEPSPGTHRSGVSLRRALRDDVTLQRGPYAFAQLSDQCYAVRSGKWLYVDNPNDYMPFSVPKQGTYPIAKRELYDLERDPRERKNVVEFHPDVANQMLGVLNEWKKQLRRRSAIAQDMSAADMAELEALGYLGGAADAAPKKPAKPASGGAGPVDDDH